MRTLRHAGDVRRIYGSASDAELLRYGRTVAPSRTAIRERAKSAGDLGQDPAVAVENLELLRATLHIEVDQLIDEQELRYPDPVRLIFRAPCHRESGRGEAGE